MMYRVVMDETAKADLRDISITIAENAGDKDVAVKFVSELKKRCKELRTFPERGGLPKDHLLVSLGYRFLPYKGYLVFYVIDKDARCVFLRAVWHEKMDYSRHRMRLIEYSLNKLQEDANSYITD